MTKIKMKKNGKVSLKITISSIAIITICFGIEDVINLFNPVVNKEGIQLVKCIDGDTAKFNINNKEETVRFIAIDTPELRRSNQKGPDYYGKEAAEYTCNALENANVIEFEYDSNSNERDKYGRVISWIYVDGSLLQTKLVENGYARVEYIYGDYKYLNELYAAEKNAKAGERGVWSEK